MNQAIVTRSARDRVRYAFLFELFLMALLAVGGAIVLQRHVLDVGTLALLLSLKAMIFNLIYNFAYDGFDVRAGRVPTERSPLGRLIHAVGFEFGLVLTSLPLIMLWLNLSLLHALALDLAAALLVVIYTIAFGWGYDRLFPVPQPLTASCT